MNFASFADVRRLEAAFGSDYLAPDDQRRAGLDQ
jgi:hypothetical protein